MNNGSAPTPRSEEQRSGGRRRDDVPVADDRRKEERRDVPGVTELLGDLERADGSIDTPER